MLCVIGNSVRDERLAYLFMIFYDLMCVSVCVGGRGRGGSYIGYVCQSMHHFMVGDLVNVHVLYPNYNYICSCIT